MQLFVIVNNFASRPIQCPQIDNPTPELITQFHEVYMHEVKRLYDHYKNVYDFDNIPLKFK